MENEEDLTSPSTKVNAVPIKVGLILIRIFSFIFSNMKLIMIGIQLAVISNLDNNIEAAGLDSSCSWYWGGYSIFGSDDYTMTNNNNQNNGEFRMTCNNVTCSQVCPGDCNTAYISGNTMVETGNYGIIWNVCEVDIRYLQLIFILSVFSLAWDALLQLYIGIHMIYSWFRPDSHWGFTSNIHIRSVWMAIVYLFHPGKAINWLLNPAKMIYPPIPDVTPTPYIFILCFTAFVDFPYAIGALLWSFYAGDSIGIYLAISSTGNLLLNFLLMYYLQFLEDIKVFYEGTKSNREYRSHSVDVSHQLLPIR
jgi:hypothetical protein